MSFNQQNFSARFGALGDEAEGIFEAVWPTGWVRYGLNRPPLSMAKLPLRVRHTPDYLTSFNFVEVKGIGRDDTIKIKVAELNCMHFWHQVHPMLLFVWSSHRKSWASMPLTSIDALIDNGAVTLDKYHDGRAYFAISADNFVWTSHDA